MAFRWRADDGPTLNTGLVAAIFPGIRTCIARKPCIFQGGGGPDPLSPPLDPHMSYQSIQQGNGFTLLLQVSIQT